MDTEEIQIKLQMKADQFNQGLRSIQQESEKTGHQVGEHFIHAESKGKAFHKMLHEISDISPIAGIAIRTALDPITTVILGITSALQAYEKEQEKAIKQSEEYAKREVNHYMLAFDAAAKSRDEIRKGNDEQAKFEAQIGREKPADIEKERHGDEVESARREASTDSEFLAKKKMLDLNEELIVTQKEDFALNRKSVV